MFDLDLDTSKHWIFSHWARVIFLSAVTFGVFFVAEHNFRNASTENFVTDIEVQESWADGGNSLRRISFLGCAGIGILSLMLGKLQNFRWNFPAVLVVIYLLWAGASITWSIDPGATVRRYSLMVCCAIGCFGFCRFIKMEQVILTTIIVTLGFMFVGIAGEIVAGIFRPYSGEYRFAGTVHPNTQAANLAIGCIAAYLMTMLKPKQKTIYIGIFGLMFLFLILTKSRTATAAMPVSLMVIWFVSQPIKNIVLGLVAGVWVISFTLLMVQVTNFSGFTGSQEVLLLGRGEETGSSLTGRLPLWQDLAVYISYKPWLGHGYGAFWNPRHITDIAIGQEWVISEAHSSYVDTALQLFYAAIVFRKTLRPEYLFIVGGVVFCLIRGSTESGLSGPLGLSSFLFLALASHSWNGHQKLIDLSTEVNNDSLVPARFSPPQIPVPVPKILMTKPDISVVVCSYNRADSLVEAIERSFARNRGIQESNATWIAFFDDDELAEPDWLLQLHSAAKENEVKCVGGGVKLKFNGGVERDLRPWVRVMFGSTDDMEGGRIYDGKRVPGAGNMLVHKEVFEKVGSFRTDLVEGGEDTDLYHRMRRAGFEAYHNPLAVIHHQIPSSRIEPKYLRSTSMRMGVHISRREYENYGKWMFPLVVVGRVFQTAIVHIPKLLLAKFSGDEELILERNCYWWMWLGYFQAAYRFVFLRNETVTGLDFRGEREVASD